MTKKVINVGTAANDKKGDSLRAAFQKVNANFTELYEAVGISDTGQDTALTFLGSTISTDDSSSIIIDRATTVNSNLTVGGDILPQTSLGGNLGSPTHQWKSLYVSTNTIYINNVPLSIDGSNNITVNGTPISQTIEYADIPNAPADISELTDNTNLLGGGSTNQLVNGANTVSLGGDGTLTLPGTGTIRTAYGAMAITAPTGTSNLSIKSNDLSTYMIVGNGSAGVTAGSYNWSFSNTGNLTFPNSTVQTTAYPGTAAAAKLPYYADTSARDTAIPSPANGMMVIVGGDVYFYGAAQWHQLTVAA